MSVLFIKLDKGVSFEISNDYQNTLISFRSNLYLDIQSKDQGETIQMGVGWSCSPTTDIDKYFSVSVVNQ